MMPSFFECLNKLPLPPSGKIDRQALPAPDSVWLQGQEVYVAPRTPTEEILAGIWREVLGLEKIGKTDNFIDLGENSLSATQIIARVLDSFQVDISLKNFFEAPTIIGLVNLIQSIKVVDQIIEKIQKSQKDYDKNRLDLN